MKATMLSDRLYQLRTGKRMRQKLLADAIGVDSTTYSRIEKGERRPKEEQLPTLAKMLDVETTELYSLLVADKMAVAVGDAPNEIADMAISILHKNI